MLLVLAFDLSTRLREKQSWSHREQFSSWSPGWQANGKCISVRDSSCTFVFMSCVWPNSWLAIFAIYNKFHEVFADKERKKERKRAWVMDACEMPDLTCGASHSSSLSSSCHCRFLADDADAVRRLYPDRLILESTMSDDGSLRCTGEKSFWTCIQSVNTPSTADDDIIPKQRCGQPNLPNDINCEVLLSQVQQQLRTARKKKRRWMRRGRVAAAIKGRQEEEE
jgi:hypothetical protein